MAVPGAFPWEYNGAFNFTELAQAQTADKTDGTGSGAITLLKPFVSASYLSHIHGFIHWQNNCNRSLARIGALGWKCLKNVDCKSTANIGCEIAADKGANVWIHLGLHLLPQCD